ncbi:hypothetical protein RIF29_17968 [Crotalaria pallida]|uniref:Uncharacterized protein n=1 Tax=Crotalaria pallida TaxID=3830 RepID=A0AAN9FI24_CROPI
MMNQPNQNNSGNDALIPPGFEDFIVQPQLLQKESTGGNEALAVPPGFEVIMKIHEKQLLQNKTVVIQEDKLADEEDKQSPNVVAHCGLTFSSFNVKNALAEMESNNKNDMVTLQVGGKLGAVLRILKKNVDGKIEKCTKRRSSRTRMTDFSRLVDLFNSAAAAACFEVDSAEIMVIDPNGAITRRSCREGQKSIWLKDYSI